MPAPPAAANTPTDARTHTRAAAHAHSKTYTLTHKIGRDAEFTFTADGCIRNDARLLSHLSHTGALRQGADDE